MHASTFRLVRGTKPGAAQADKRIHQRAVQRKNVCRASQKDEQQSSLQMQHITAFAASAAISAAVLLNPFPASADLVQTVPVGQMTQMARALPKQYIDKTKVWTVFIGGAASLFILTVAAENNKSWFPAIARANAAMSEARKRAEQAENSAPPADIYTAAEPAPRSAPVEQELPPLDIDSAALEAEIERRNALAEAAEAERVEIARQSKLVEEALLATRKKVLDTPEQPAAAAAPPTPAAASSSSKLEANPAAEESSGSSNGSHSTSSSSSTTSSSPNGDASAAGYTVVAETSAAPAAVAWQGSAAQPAAAAAESTGTQSAQPAALAGVLESRELMQQYKEQQKQQQQQEVHT